MLPPYHIHITILTLIVFHRMLNHYISSKGDHHVFLSPSSSSPSIQGILNQISCLPSVRIESDTAGPAYSPPPIVFFQLIELPMWRITQARYLSRLCPYGPQRQPFQSATMTAMATTSASSRKQRKRSDRPYCNRRPHYGEMTLRTWFIFRSTCASSPSRRLSDWRRNDKVLH